MGRSQGKRCGKRCEKCSGTQYQGLVHFVDGEVKGVYCFGHGSEEANTPAWVCGNCLDAVPRQVRVSKKRRERQARVDALWASLGTKANKEEESHE